MCYIENSTKHNQIVLHIFGLKFSFRNNLKFYFWELIGLFLDFYFFLKRINLNKNYKIISLGTYCLPRMIATVNKLKPTRKKGEKSCPFDLAFSDFDENVELISYNFENFFDGLEQNSDGRWVNSKIKMIYNHDDSLTKDEFTERYNARIKNLYNYFSDKSKHKFILSASLNPITPEQIKNLQNALEKYMDKNNFDIILINQSKEICNYNDVNVHIINQHENFKLWKNLNENYLWPSAIRKKYLPEALKIYYEITNSMINIIKKVMKNKT